MNTDIKVQNTVKKVVRRNIAKIAMDILRTSRPEIIESLMKHEETIAAAEQKLREARFEQESLLQLA